MWSNLPSDLLSNIFLFLSPDSFACANATCRNWHQACASTLKIESFSLKKHIHPPWFVALPLRNNTLFCYTHHPTNETWYELPLHFLPYPVRLLSHLKGLLLVKPSISTTLHLALCNPFTKQFKPLPMLNTQRTNPAVGVVFTTPHLTSEQNGRRSSLPCYEIYVAGGMSEAPHGGATYEPTLEMYDPRARTWRVVGTMPMEYAVRLTVWTPEESVYCGGVLYWMTSARAYSLMAYDVMGDRWREHSVPMAEKLEFAALVLRKGRVTLVGGMRGIEGCVWELIEEGERWVEVETVPSEMGRRLRGEKGSWERTKCVGGDGGVYLYRELCGGMVVWREVEESKWEWVWVEGCEFIRGKQVRNLQIKGVLVHPNLVPSSIF